MRCQGRPKMAVKAGPEWRIFIASVVVIAV